MTTVSEAPTFFTAPALFTSTVPSVNLVLNTHDTLDIDADSIDVRQVLSGVFGIPVSEVDEEMVEVATEELSLDGIEGYMVDRVEALDGSETPVVVFARERMITEVLSTLLW